MASVYFNESPIGHCLASVGKGAPNHDGVMVALTETATVVCGGVRARVCSCIRPCIRACVMCLQYTMIIFYHTDNDNNKNYYPIFHTNQTH